MTEAGPGSAIGDDGSLKKACDQCRTRKIRCDKESPCSNCRIANRSCTSTGIGQRPKEARARVLISSQYERKIDRIDSRLGNIEALLRKLPALSSRDHPRVEHTPTTTVSSNSGIVEDSSDESGFGGDHGLTAQTAFASEFLEGAVKKTSLREASPKIEAALANLGQLVQMQTQRSISHGPRFPDALQMPPGGPSKLPMPPSAVVTSLLKNYKDSSATLLVVMCGLAGIRDFTSLCRDVYFPTEDYSDSLFIIVSYILYNMFIEQRVQVSDPAVQAEYNGYLNMLRANIETGLANLPLFLSPKVETVQALYLGVMYAIDVSRPSVAWHLISTAGQLAQTGGFHRMECLKYDTPQVIQTKTLLFWNIYTMEKGLGLRLGRASTMRDYDISIPRAMNFEGFPLFSTSPYPSLWLRIATLQGSIYEQLYSPVALSGDQASLVNRARVLGRECRDLESLAVHSRRQQIDLMKGIQMTSFLEALYKGDEVQFYVTMTLVYRVIPAPEGSPTRFCDECLDSARQAINTHLNCIKTIGDDALINSIYVHWNLMLTPFAPFFVLFCYVIETSSATDLKILNDFLQSLENMRSTSVTVEKLYRLCQVMCDAAKLYLEAKSQQQQDQNMASIGDEFEMYLGQLGFMPEDQVAYEARNTTGGPGQARGDVADWYTGNQKMIDLLESDLTGIDPLNWLQQGGPNVDM